MPAKSASPSANSKARECLAVQECRRCLWIATGDCNGDVARGFIVDQEEMIARADRHGIIIVALAGDDTTVRMAAE